MCFYWIFLYWIYVEELPWAHFIAIIPDVSKRIALLTKDSIPITRNIPKVLWALCQELGAKIKYVSYGIGYHLVFDHESLRMKVSSSYKTVVFYKSPIVS